MDHWQQPHRYRHYQLGVRDAFRRGPGAAGSTPNCAPTNLSGIYGVDSDIYLRTPAIDLTTASGATLNFDPQALAEWHLDNAIATIP